MGPLTDSFQSSNLFLLLFFLLISVNGKTYKSAIERPIKIRTHHIVRKHLPATVTDKKLTDVYRDQPYNFISGQVKPSEPLKLMLGKS